jgi:hypothetical protein
MGKWTEKKHRGVESQKLMLSVEAALKAHGWRRDRPKAVKLVIAELREKNPAYKIYDEGTLRAYYYRARRQPAPLPTKEDRRKARLTRWASLLMQWGKQTKRHLAFISAEQAREIVDRLIAVTPRHRRDDLDQLFNHMSIHRTGREKIKWLQSVIARLGANPNDWPIPISRRGRADVVAGKIETYLANPPGKRAHKRDIVAALKIPRTTVQTTLSSLARARRIERRANGVYSMPTEGVSCAPYVSADKAMLNVLGKGGQRSCAELRAETGKSVGAVSAALHRLHNAGRIVRTNRGRYASAGSEPPHVYARDAICVALRSGQKTMTMPELIATTGKKGLSCGLRLNAWKRREALSKSRSAESPSRGG